MRRNVTRGHCLFGWKKLLALRWIPPNRSRPHSGYQRNRRRNHYRHARRYGDSLAARARSGEERSPALGKQRKICIKQRGNTSVGVKIREKVKDSGVYWIFVNHAGQRTSRQVGSLKAAEQAKERIEARLTLGEWMPKEKPPAPTLAEYY